MNELLQISQELKKIARQLCGRGARLVALIDERGKVVKRRGEAVEGVGIFDDRGNEYAGGFDRDGMAWGSVVDVDNTIELFNGKRSDFKVGEIYPEVL